MLSCCTGDKPIIASFPMGAFPTWCSNYPKCIAEGMIHGGCCPNANGSVLPCCEGGTAMHLESIQTVNSPYSSLCSTHSHCVAEGLAGQCCPTLGGTLMPCCTN